MDNVCHTLVGAALAQSGLKKRSPLATITLLIAANIPDVDVLSLFWGGTAGLGFRRGWTHGILAVPLWPFLLAGAVVLFDRGITKRGARFWPLVLVSFVGVVSHPLLDLLNTYGVRLLMPFSDRWFYGDTLFIVDPWLWLLFGSAVMLAWTARRSGVVLWIVIGAATTLLIAMNPLVPAWSRITWLVALAALAAGRYLAGPVRSGRLAIGGIVLALAYIASMYTGSRLAEDEVRNWAALSGWRPLRVAAMSVPVESFRRVVIVDTPTRYVLVPVRWINLIGSDRVVDEVLRFAPEFIEKGPPHPAIDAALRLPELQGTVRWLRFPSYEVSARPDGGYQVIIRDARFTIGTPQGFGVIAVVQLDRNLKPLTSSSLP